MACWSTFAMIDRREEGISMDRKIFEAGQPDDAAIDRLGNKLLIGNGYLGYRGTLEEYGKAQKTACIVSGLYDRVGNLWREPVNFPNAGFVQLIYQNEALSVLTSKVVDHTQWLDHYAAEHGRRTVFETQDGAQITLQCLRFAHLGRLPLLAIQVTVCADRDCSLTVRCGIDAQVWDLNGPHLENICCSEEEGMLTVDATTHEKGIPLLVSQQVVGAGDVQVIQSDDGIFHEARLDLQAGREFRFEVYATHFFGQDLAYMLPACRKLTADAAACGYAHLLQEHAALWAERWQRSDVLIQGDPVAQEALHFSLYHLLSIAPTHSDQVSIPARGLSGQVYKGGIFWDTEIFMLPFFIHTFPEIARSLLLYRVNTLDGARRKAREYGYQGAFYAWESQEGGEEACTLFNVTDVFTDRPMRTYFRDKQIHISADIVYAFWHYYRVSGDETIWLQGGAEVVFECARFYASCAYYSPSRKRYEFLDVTGPDEYHERVHNNTFTNLMAAQVFDVCLAVLALLRKEYPTRLAELLDALQFEPDLALVEAIAGHIYLPHQCANGTAIPQFDGYFSLEDVPLDQLLARKLKPTEYLGGGNGLATTTQILKQADVVLAMALFPDKFTRGSKSANWKYYQPRTEHGSSLSACSYALIASQIGKPDLAYKYFLDTARIDITGEGKQYVGPLYIGGTHPAANGGAWMAAVLGLCGIRCVDRTIIIDPHLPEHWNQVVLPLTVKGQRIQIIITPEAVSVKAIAPFETSLTVQIGGVVRSIPPSGETGIYKL